MTAQAKSEPVELLRAIRAEAAETNRHLRWFRAVTLIFLVMPAIISLLFAVIVALREPIGVFIHRWFG